MWVSRWAEPRPHGKEADGSLSAEACRSAHSLLWFCHDDHMNLTSCILCVAVTRLAGTCYICDCPHLFLPQKSRWLFLYTVISQSADCPSLSPLLLKLVSHFLSFQPDRSTTNLHMSSCQKPARSQGHRHMCSCQVCLHSVAHTLHGLARNTHPPLCGEKVTGLNGHHDAQSISSGSRHRPL